MATFYLKASIPPICFQLEPGFNTIGRNPTNDLRLKDSTISSFHCELVLEGDTVKVHDLGSTNGTFVDDARIDQAELPPGGVLRLGSFALNLVREEEGSVQISMPKLSSEKAPESAVLADGSAACMVHRGTYAAFQCTRCQKMFCEECVRILGLAGGQTRVFCPACSGTCEGLAVPPGALTRPVRKKSVLGRLTQTLRLRLK